MHAAYHGSRMPSHSSFPQAGLLLRILIELPLWVYMSYSLNSFKGGYIGDCFGGY